MTVPIRFSHRSRPTWSRPSSRDFPTVEKSWPANSAREGLAKATVWANIRLRLSATSGYMNELSHLAPYFELYLTLHRVHPTKTYNYTGRRSPGAPGCTWLYLPRSPQRQLGCASIGLGREQIATGLDDRQAQASSR
jgi:hypothetical protein